MYEPNNILITGGCGFIGSNVLNYLMKNYPNIKFVNVDKLDYCSTTKNVIIQPNYIFIKGDIKNEILVKKILNDYNIDTIIHFAAQTHVDNSFENAMLFIEENIIATYILLKSSVEYNKLKRFIHVSTDEVYGESELNSDTNTEETILNPTNPYSASKASAEYYVKSYFKCYKLPIIITRGNNVFGPRQFPEKLIPKFITKLFSNDKCTIHGTGKNLRNFIYVDDVSTAFETILFKGEIGQIYNIGTKNEYSVKEITYDLIKLIKNDQNYDKYIEYIKDRPWNDLRYTISSDKLQKLGWKEQTDFYEGLNKTINWYYNLDKNYWNNIWKNH